MVVGTPNRRCGAINQQVSAADQFFDMLQEILFVDKGDFVHACQALGLIIAKVSNAKKKIVFFQSYSLPNFCIFF